MIDKPPVAFGRRIKFWRQCFAKLSVLTDTRDEALTFADDLHAAALKRHTLIHFNWGEVLAGAPTQTVQGAFLRVKGQRHLLYRGEMSIPGLHEFTSEIDALNTRLVALGLGISNAVRAQRSASPWGLKHT